VSKAWAAEQQLECKLGTNLRARTAAPSAPCVRALARTFGHVRRRARQRYPNEIDKPATGERRKSSNCRVEPSRGVYAQLISYSVVSRTRSVVSILRALRDFISLRFASAGVSLATACNRRESSTSACARGDAMPWLSATILRLSRRASSALAAQTRSRPPVVLVALSSLFLPMHLDQPARWLRRGQAPRAHLLKHRGRPAVQRSKGGTAVNSTVPTARAHIYHMPRPRVGTRALSPPHLSAPLGDLRSNAGRELPDDLSSTALPHLLQVLLHIAVHGKKFQISNPDSVHHKI